MQAALPGGSTTEGPEVGTGELPGPACARPGSSGASTHKIGEQRREDTAHTSAATGWLRRRAEPLAENRTPSVCSPERDRRIKSQQGPGLRDTHPHRSSWRESAGVQAAHLRPRAWETDTAPHSEVSSGPKARPVLLMPPLRVTGALSVTVWQGANIYSS